MSLEASYPPEPVHPSIPTYLGEGMTAAEGRLREQQIGDGGATPRREVVELRTGAGGVTPLMVACQEGHERTVRQILHMKPSMLQERDRTGKTALHYCTDNPTLACIDQLVAADPSLLSAREEDGHTPLHLATIAGNGVVAKYLITRGADVNALDNEKHTAIHWATVCGEEQLLDLLIEAGGNPSTPDIHGAYPIHYAAQMCGPNGDPNRDMSVGLRILKKLIQHGVPLDVQDRDGRQPLLWAASSGSADAIMALRKAKADIEAADKDGLTALHCAASRGHLDCMDMLITFCNSEVDLLDSNGCSPLFYSVTLGHADCTQLLLNNGADANRQDKKGRTPAHCGAAKGQLETLKLLHQHNADLWKRNVKGDLPLHEACMSGRKDLVVWLLSMMPEHVNAANSDGRTPLHIGAITSNTGLCKILMDNNAEVNPIMRNSRGQLLTPVDAAIARGHKDCAQYLQLHGGSSAAKLTDKRALQIALSKVMDGGSGDRTGATPNSELGYQDLLLPGSASSGRRSKEAASTAIISDGSSQTDDHHEESGYSGSHQDDSELDFEDNTIKGKKLSARERKRKVRKEERETLSEDEDAGEADGRGPGRLAGEGEGGREGGGRRGGGGGRTKNAGGRYHEDGDEYNFDAYEEMEDLPRHLANRRSGKTRPLSGGPDRVHALDDSDIGTRRRPVKGSAEEMSITQAMQTTTRKYTLERRLFQQLLELKRHQIRNSKVNETVLVKRMAEGNNKDGAMLGLRGYGGPMAFSSYEKYLYDQLRFLQSTQVEKIPKFRPIDDIEKLNRALQRADIAESKKNVGSSSMPDLGDIPDDPRQCAHRTHRCHHAAHAYTGIPCAAYLAPRRNRPVDDKKGRAGNDKLNLPRIGGSTQSSGPPTFRSRGGSRRDKLLNGDEENGPQSMGVKDYDPQDPLTVELQPSSTPPTDSNSGPEGGRSAPASSKQKRGDKDSKGASPASAS